MIQARCIMPGVPNYRKLLQHIWKALRPGGVFFVIEGRLALFDEHRQKLGVQNEGDPARNSQITYLDDIPTWLEDMGDAWEEVGDNPIFVPVGPWDTTSPESIYLGEIMRQNNLKFIESLQPLLLSRGHPNESVQTWAQNARKELQELPFKHWAKRLGSETEIADELSLLLRIRMPLSTVDHPLASQRESSSYFRDVLVLAYALLKLRYNHPVGYYGPLTLGV
ncbi:hypothetical protein FRC01_011393 [Tulasnella sp. 417]|nr:hypothetical protein FRC01_011393 [Tulasnella sp. 417]